VSSCFLLAYRSKVNKNKAQGKTKWKARRKKRNQSHLEGSRKIEEEMTKRWGILRKKKEEFTLSFALLVSPSSGMRVNGDFVFHDETISNQFLLLFLRSVNSRWKCFFKLIFTGVGMRDFSGFIGVHPDSLFAALHDGS
jgi:hypothetical protein